MGAGNATALTLALGLTTAASALVPVKLAGPGGNGDTAGSGGKREKSDTQVYDCDQDADSTDRTITYSGTVEARPPNHKYRFVDLTARDADNAGTTTITVVGSHDQMVSDTEEMNGAGNTDPATDVVPTDGAPTSTGNGSATESFKYRGERSGRDKTGRTYTFNATATWDDGETCSHSFTAFVPHDQGNHGKPTSKQRRARR